MPNLRDSNPSHRNSTREVRTVAKTPKTITARQILQSSRNPLHLEHITNGIKGGAFGGTKKDKHKRDRRAGRLEARLATG